MKNKFKWSFLATVALAATVAMAADKYISSSGNIVLKTATSKSVNLQDTVYATQAGRLGIGTSSPGSSLDVAGSVILGDTSTTNFRHLIRGGLDVRTARSSFTDDEPYAISLKHSGGSDFVYLGATTANNLQISSSGGSALVTVQQNGNVLLGNTTKKFQSLTGYYGLPDNVYTPIIAVGSYFTMRLIVMCYGDSSRSASSIFDFSSHVGVPSTYTQTGIKYNNVTSMLVRVNGNNVELLADTTSGSGMNCYYNAQGIDNTEIWGSY